MFPEAVKPIHIEFACDSCGVHSVASYGGSPGYLRTEDVIEIIDWYHKNQSPNCKGEIEILVPGEILMNDDPYADYTARHVN